MNPKSIHTPEQDPESTAKTPTIRDDAVLRDWSFHRDLSVLTSGLRRLFGSGGLAEGDETRRGDVVEVTATTAISVKVP
jgi:hypothetical protein